MRRILGSVLLLYTLLVCFGDAFKLHPWLPLPLVLLLGGVVAAGWAALLAPRIRLERGFFRPFDLLLVAYVLELGVSLLFSGSIDVKNINHLVAYTTVVALYYFFVKFLFAAAGTWAHYESRVRTVLVCSVLLVSVYTMLEFIDTNLTPLGVTALVRSRDELATYRPLFLVFVRARGLMGEPATLALFLNIFVPMSVVYLRGRLGTMPALLFLVVAAGAFGATFSAAGLLFICVGLLVALGLYVYDRGVVFVPLRWTIVLGCVAVLVGTVAVRVPGDVWSDIGAKLTLTDPGSGWERVRNWSAAAPLAAAHPFLGTGIGSTSVETGTGVVSLYLTMLKEAGLPSLLLIVAFLCAVFHEILVLPRRDPYKYAYAASFVAAACHYAVISDIWYPWLWLLCSFAIAQRRVYVAAAS